MFRLKVSSKKAWIAACLFLIAVISVFLAAILPNFSGAAIPLLGYPVFWEVMGGALVVFASILLATYFFRIIFDRKNYKKFFETSRSIVARGIDQELRALADEVRYSARAIVESACQYDPDRARRAESENRGYAVSEQTEYALALLDLFSDEGFCKILVDAAPATAMDFIQAIIDSGRRSVIGYAFVQQIIEQSFISGNSMLHREQEEYSGLGHFRTFTKTVFGSYQFVASQYRPLQAWAHWREEFATRKYIQKFALALHTAVEGYFEDESWQYPAVLYSGIERLAESAQFRLPRMKDIPEEEIYSSEAYRINSEIGDALRELLALVVQHENDIPDFGFNEATYDRYSDASIYGVLAFGIYTFLEKLSMDRAHDEAIRMLAIQLWIEVDPTSDDQRTKAIQETQKRLLIHLKRKMAENLEKLHYPMVTRLMISLIGLNEPQEGSQPSFAMTELHGLLRSRIANAFELNEEKAQDILPGYVKFDKTNNSLVWKMQQEKTPHIFPVDPPGKQSNP